MIVVSGNRISRISEALALKQLGCLILLLGGFLIAFIIFVALVLGGSGGSLLPSPGAQCDQMPQNMPNSPYVQVAWDDAQNHSICARYFVNQIRQESGFNPNAVSSAGAVGIAQFMAGTAPTWGLKVGGGIDERRDPVKSLDAAARMMAAAYKNYLQNNSPEDAYEKALAAYNAGSGAVQNAERRYGSQWLNGLSQQPYDYVDIIMELNLPKK